MLSTAECAVKYFVNVVMDFTSGKAFLVIFLSSHEMVFIESQNVLS